MDSTAPATAARTKHASGPVVYRHSIATRVTHWTGFVALVVLFMSGLQIFNAAPYLDASDNSDPARRVLAISGTQAPAAGGVLGAPVAAPRGHVRLFGLDVPTTHVFGFGDDGQGGESVRAFPGWLTLPAYQDLADGRRWHLFFSWVFVAVGAAYLVFGALRRDLALIVLRPSDLPKMLPMQLYYFGLRPEPPPHGKYNPLQKAGYTAVLFVLSPFVVITGLALSPGVDAWVHPVTTLLGGRQFARTWHFVAMLALLGFFVGHVFLVVSTGLLNNMRSMTAGTYRLGKNEGTGP